MMLFPSWSSIIRVGVHFILKLVKSFSSSDGIFTGMRCSWIALIRLESGYVTVSICWQPIQPGLKKSTKTYLFSALAV
jgi:hypothetical protein